MHGDARHDIPLNLLSWQPITNLGWMHVSPTIART